jgi:PAS domain S-box-containing protein
VRTARPESRSVIFAAPVFLAGRRIWHIGVALALLVLLGAGFDVWDMRRAAISAATSDMQDMGLVLSEQASRYIQLLDVMLKETQSRSRELGVRTPDDFRRAMGDEDTHRFLVERIKNLPQARAAAIFGADGMEINTSRTTPPAMYSVADIGYFQYLRDHPESALYVSGPGPGHVSHEMSVFLARRISGPDGGFLGVAVTAVNVAYLIDFYEAIGIGRHVSVTLLRRDGLLLARYPAPTVVRDSMPMSSNWYAVVAAGGGPYHTPGYFSETSAIVVAKPVHDYPVVIDVSIHDADVLATWRRQAAYTLSAGITLAAALVGLSWMVARHLRRQAEHAVARSGSERRLRDFAELASDWFWEQDADLRFIEVGMQDPSRPRDDRFCVGKQRSDLCDTSRDPEGWKKHQLDLLGHHRFHDFRYSFANGDGSLRHISVNGTPTFDAAGEFSGYRGTGRDVTAEVEHESELRKARDHSERSELLLHDAVDSMSEGFVMFDDEDRFVTCNDAYRATYAERASYLVPGAKFEDILRNVLADGGISLSHGREAEWLAERLKYHHNPTGSVEQLQANGTWIMATDRRMKSGGLAGLRIDITALKRAEAALRESEAHLDRAQAIANVGSWELELATGHAIWSKELYRIRGVSPEEFQPNTTNGVVFIHPDDYPEVARWIAGLAAGIDQAPRETRNIRPTGEVRLVRVEGRALTDPDGVIRRLAGTMQDITDQRGAEQKLVQAQKMEAIGNLTGGMAHDFNNSLGVIIGNLDLLGRRIKSDAASTELCDEARDGALRCADRIRLLLAFARQQTLRPRQTDVNILIKRTAKLLAHTLGETITLSLHLGVALSQVVADQAQLEAAVTNLANNARDAMPGGGHLDITTKTATLDAEYAALHQEVTPGTYVLIEISDSGTGISPDVINHIFEPFFTTKETGLGTGLGLSMVFGFVRQSGGHLAVYSELGHGSTFRIYLPRVVTGTAETATPTDFRPILGGNETVLVVEDNTKLREATARQLAALGYELREAEHAAAALTILSSGDRLDLLFSDIVMPGTMDGLDLAHRATQLRPQLKVLLTSGFPGIRGADRRLANDCPFSLLGKPYGHDELARAVRDTLDRSNDWTSPTVQSSTVQASAAQSSTVQSSTARNHSLFDCDLAITKEQV